MLTLSQGSPGTRTMGKRSDLFCVLYLQSNVCLANSVFLPTVVSIWADSRTEKVRLRVACFCKGTVVLGAKEIGRQ